MKSINPTISTFDNHLNWTISLVQLLPVVIQLGLLGIVIHIFQIEADLGLTIFFPWMCGAFLVHALLPLQIRPKIQFIFFVVILSLFVGEWGTLKIVGLGFLIMSICHIPIPIIGRKILALSLGVLLGLSMLGDISTIFTDYELRIATTLLMFRTILYLHELPHEKESESVSFWQRINYFFMLPNIILPLFPIVDYQKHKRQYYDIEANKIYQSGINLILWSLVCILSYRFLYHFIIPNQLRLDGVQEVTIYIIVTYLTVIRLVGLLTLAVGVLRLFGYNLPDIFNYMFFASSFSDLFKRINIYWKDFLMKLCYYPTYFRVRKWSPTYALTIATLVTFFFTWLFHVYQWFWVLGTNPISETGMIYWGIFGLVATLNTLSERKQKRIKPRPVWSFATKHIAKVFLTFLSMALLYSVWMAPSFLIWSGMLVTAFQDSWMNWMKVCVYISIFYVVSCILYFWYLKKVDYWNNVWRNIQRPKTALNCSILIILLGFSFFSNSNKNIHLFVNDNQLNENDINTEYSGYYSEILDVHNDISSRIWGRDYTFKKGRVEKFQDIDIVRPVNNVLGYEFIPNTKGFFKEKNITVNSWGFRDKEYSKLPEENTIRIALVGASPTMGSGVEDEEVFEAIIERQLNEKYASSNQKFELLNFAQPSLCALHYAYQIEDKIRHFEPDYVLFVEHCRPMAGFSKKLVRVLEAENEIYPELAAFMEREKLNLETMRTKTQMAQKSESLVSFSYKFLKETCDKYNIDLIWAHVPPTYKDNYYKDYKILADRHDYSKQINLSDIYDNYSQKLLVVGANDYHPNAWAHEIIAENLLPELEQLLQLKKDKQ